MNVPPQIPEPLMASERPRTLPAELAEPLARLDQHVRNLSVLKGAGLLAVAFAAAAAAVFAVDLLWDMPLAVRSGLLVSVLLALAIAGWWWLARPWTRRTRTAELAAIVERAHPQLRERLSSAVELNDPEIDESEKGSPMMRELLVRQTLESIDEVDFTDSVPTRRTVQHVVVGAAAIVVLVVPLLYSPSEYGLLWARFLQPWNNYERVGSVYFDVTGGDRLVARGSDVTIGATLRDDSRARPEAVWFNWTTGEGTEESRRMRFDEATGTYATTVAQAVESFQFNLSANRNRSRLFRVTVVDAPVVEALELEVDPPSYTGLPAARYDGALGETRIFERSQMALRLRFDKRVTDARLIFPEPVRVEGSAKRSSDATEGTSTAKADSHEREFVVADDGLSATLRMEATIGGPVVLQWTDRHGLVTVDEGPRVFALLRDQPPRLTLHGDDEPQRLRPDDLLSVSAVVRDDIGVGALELHYERTGDESNVVSLPEAETGVPAVSHTFQVPLSGESIEDGSLVTYRVRAADERPVPGPHEVWSDARVVIIDSRAEPASHHDIAERREEIEQSLEQIRERVRENHQQVADLKQAAPANSEDAPFERNGEIQPLADEQLQLARSLEQLAARFAVHPLFRQLTADAQRIARNDLGQASKQMRGAASSEPAAKQHELSNVEKKLARADTRLADLAKRFDELSAIERDLMKLDRMAADADRLARQTKALQQQAAAADEPTRERQAFRDRLAQQQAALAADQEQLAADLDELHEQRPELAEAARQPYLDRLAELARRAEELADLEELQATGFRDESMRTIVPAVRLAKQQRELLNELQRKTADERANQQSADSPDNKSTADRSDKTSAQNPAEVPRDPAGSNQQPAAQAEAVTKKKSELAEIGAQMKGAAASLMKGNLESAAERQRVSHEKLAALSAAEPHRDDAEPNESASDFGDLAARQRELLEAVEQLQSERRQPNDESLHQARQAQRRQDALLRESAQMALDIARQAEPGSPVTDKAVDLVEKMEQAARQSSVGHFPQAAQASNEAAAESQRIQQQLESGEAFDPELSQRAQRLTEQQRELADAFRKSAMEVSTQHHAQRESQQQLAEQTGQLTEQFAQIAEAIDGKPQNATEQGDRVRQIEQTAGQSHESMQGAMEQAAAVDTGRAIDSAERASRMLRQVAEMAAAESGQPQSPIPSDVGRLVAEAAERIAEARRELAQAQQTSQSQSGSPSDQPSSNQEKGESGQNKSSSQAKSAADGSPQSSRASNTQKQSGGNKPLERSAAAMEQAASQLAEAAGQMQSQQSPAGQGGQASEQSDSPGENTDGNSGTGARATVDLDSLQSELGQLENLSARDWGRLPENLQTEILQSSSRRTDGEYARLIKLYFKAIADTEPTESSDADAN